MSVEVSKKLKKQVVNLLDDFLQIIPEDTDLLMIRIFFETSVNPNTIMEGFIQWVYPWKQQIKDRDEKYFQDNDNMFGPLPLDKVKKIRTMYNDGTFDEEDKEVIWNYFNVFIGLIEKFKKVV